MAYASFGNQFWNLSHYAAAFLIVFVGLPILLFEPGGQNRLDNLVANYLRMVLFVIVAGYLLVMTKLFEFLSLMMVLVAWMLLFRSNTGNRASAFVATAGYDLLDGLNPFRREDLLARWKTGARGGLKRLWAAPGVWLPVLCVATVFAVSALIRFTDAFTNAAPAMSDGNVTLSWMKYVNARILFHDGIYPQGMYMFMAVLKKFAFIDPLYVLKYTGPLDTVLIVFGLYYTVTRLFGQPLGGAVAALLYGVLGYLWLAGNWVDWERQAAGNSQEFGFLFALPALYFLFKYLEEGGRFNYSVALSGACVTGLAHTMAYLLFVLGGLSLGLVFVLMPEGGSWPRLWRAVLLGIISGLVSALPLGIGLLLHIPLNAPSASFAGQTNSVVAFPPLSIWDGAAVLAIGILLVLTGLAWLNGERKRAWLFAGSFGASTFALYYFGGPLTRSTVLTTRGLDLWAVIAPFAIGSLVAAALSAVAQSKVHLFLESGLSLVLLLLLATAVPFSPIVPYKMQWSADVEQFLRISQGYNHQAWMIVAPQEEYALVLGEGYRMPVSQFIASYNPALPPLTRYGANHPDRNIAPDVFIYYFKHIFQVPKSNTAVYAIEAPVYARRERYNQALAAWLSIYRQHHRLEVFYNGKNLEVFHIHQALKEKAIKVNLWNL